MLALCVRFDDLGDTSGDGAVSRLGVRSGSSALLPECAEAGVERFTGRLEFLAGFLSSRNAVPTAAESGSLTSSRLGVSRDSRPSCLTGAISASCPRAASSSRSLFSLRRGARRAAFHTAPVSALTSLPWGRDYGIAKADATAATTIATAPPTRMTVFMLLPPRPPVLFDQGRGVKV